MMPVGDRVSMSHRLSRNAIAVLPTKTPIGMSRTNEKNAKQSSAGKNRPPMPLRSAALRPDVKNNAKRKLRMRKNKSASTANNKSSNNPKNHIHQYEHHPTDPHRAGRGKTESLGERDSGYSNASDENG